MSNETHVRDDGTIRWNHYGAGRQPWDDVLEEDWGPEFCAGNILKYIRRSKEPESDLVKARWYYDRLIELSRGTITPKRSARYAEANRQLAVGRACAVMVRLLDMLTKDEVISLKG
jgi:hypothetical protein